MKSLYLRSCMALACAASLAACGGGSATLVLGGQVTGLTKTGLTLSNNGGPDLAVASGFTSFAFPQLIAPDSAFDVKVSHQPDGAHCDVQNGKGTAGAFAVTSVIVNCVTETHILKGTVENLRSAGLKIINGADVLDIASGAAAFTMPAKVADGAAYGITIFQQPAPQNCTVFNGVGRMGTTDIDNVKIICN